MTRKSVDLPMQVARQFVKDMYAYHSEPDAIKRDEIASRQLHALRQYNMPKAKRLRLSDVKEMFEQMRDQH